jgi:CRP-like cAMP-binding protein
MEVGLIGREGAVGALSVLGTKAYAGGAIVQMPGSALRIRTDIAQSDGTICPQLRALLMRFIQALFAQIVQSAACNGRHKIQERMPRWLLMAHDRADTEVLPLSHELLAMMLGVRRAGVTHAVGALREARLIESRRGRIAILNRAGLEAAACECYQTVKDEYDRLLPRGR